MKKRKAKRTQSAIDIDLKIDKAMASEEMKTKAMLNLITEIIVRITLEEFYDNKKPLE
jgi:hypothetical protein